MSCSSTSGESSKTTSTRGAVVHDAAANLDDRKNVKNHDDEPWEELTSQLDQPGLVDRFVAASALLLGTPYVNGPLGEGDAGGPDPEPRFDLERADCVTYLEESLALALTAPKSDDDYIPILDAIRYRDGQVSFPSRNHFTALDWVPANAWLLEDVTAKVAKGRTTSIQKTIDRASFLRQHGAEPRPGVDEAAQLRLDALQLGGIAAADSALRSGDLVLWVSKKEGIDIAHTGMIVRDAQGTLIHRHASSKAGMAVDEPLLDYAARAASFSDGIVVLRLKPDAEPPQSSREDE
jgi:hypothetical protein